MEEPEKPPQCEAIVEKRDTYRVRRGFSGFRMHYNRVRCSRPAKVGGLCAQHAKVAEGRYLARTR